MSRMPAPCGFTPLATVRKTLAVTRTATRLAVATTTGAVLALAGVASAEVEDVVPADALVVIKANNIQQVSDDIAALSREWALDQVNPAFADPIAAFRQESGINQGVDFSADGAIFFANHDMNGEQPPMVILIPITDYQAFLGNFQNVRQTDGVDTADLPESQEPAYLGNWGEYAAMSPLAELVKNKPNETLQFGGVTGERVDERDLVVYANFKTLGPKLQQAMQERNAREQFMQEFNQGFADAPQGVQKYKPVLQTAADQLFNAAEAFLRDTDAATWSIDFDPAAGIATNVVAQFKPDSYLGNTLPKFESSDDSLLTGLPDGNYLMYGGSVGDVELSSQLFEDFAGPVLAELDKVEGAEPVKQYVEQVKKVIQATESSRFGLMAPTGPMGGSPLVQQVLIQNGQAQQISDATKQMAQAMPKLMQQFARDANVPQGEMPDVSTSFTEDAKTVAGVSFAKFSTQLPQNDPMQAMMMNMVFGPEGQVTYAAVVEDSYVTVGGLTDAQIAEVVNAVKAESDALSQKPGLDLVNQNLPEQRTGAFYINVGEMARTGLGFAQAFGQAPPVEIPQNLPPIGAAFGPAENAIQSGLFIPKDLVSAMIVTALQVQQGQQRGPGGGL